MKLREKITSVKKVSVVLDVVYDHGKFLDNIGRGNNKAVPEWLMMIHCRFMGSNDINNSFHTLLSYLLRRTSWLNDMHALWALEEEVSVGSIWEISFSKYVLGCDAD